jgi:hypothetical protein
MSLQERQSDAAGLARERARANPHGFGVAYVWQPISDPSAVGWRGTVVISDGETTVESPVYADGQSPYATPDPDELAVTVELLVVMQHTTLREAIANLSVNGRGIPIDRPDDLILVFR